MFSMTVLAPMTVLTIASERHELSGFARRLDHLRTLDWGLDYSSEGMLGK